MDQNDKESELLDKLDGLIRSGRGRKRLDPPPVLTDAIPDPEESAIPTLTDAVESQVAKTADQPPATEEPASQTESEAAEEEEEETEPAVIEWTAPETETPTPGPESQLAASLTASSPDRASDQKLVTDRLLANIGREIASLSKALPAHSARLAVLHRTLRFALPELIRLRWEEAGNPDAVDSSDANDTPLED